jgi:putative transposase
MSKPLSGTEIIGKLCQADVLLAQGKTVPEVCREIGVTSQTYYLWRNKYGGMSAWTVR